LLFSVEMEINMSDQPCSGAPASNGDVSMLVMGTVGKPIVQGTAAVAGTIAGGTALAASGIPVVAALGTTVAASGTTVLSGAAAVATGLGATGVASGITGASVAATTLGLALAPFIAPVALVGGTIALFAWLASDD
jgi:hypothetical protein